MRPIFPNFPTSTEEARSDGREPTEGDPGVNPLSRGFRWTLFLVTVFISLSFGIVKLLPPRTLRQPMGLRPACSEFPSVVIGVITHGPGRTRLSCRPAPLPGSRLVWALLRRRNSRWPVRRWTRRRGRWCSSGCRHSCRQCTLYMRRRRIGGRRVH